MSKAFTRDENEGPDLADLPQLVSALPPGTTNYLTARGAERLRSDLARMVEEERPRLLEQSRNDEDAKRRLLALDQRIFHLEQSLATAHVVEATPGPAARVTFGATVTVRDKLGATMKYRIVGVDETDPENGCISWLSPLARALIGKSAGTVIPSPGADNELEVVEIAYE
jgi:transcription elongation factor GreB